MKKLMTLYRNLKHYNVAPLLMIDIAALTGGYLLLDLLCSQARFVIGTYPNPLIFLIPIFALAVYGGILPALPKEAFNLRAA